MVSSETLGPRDSSDGKPLDVSADHRALSNAQTGRIRRRKISDLDALSPPDPHRKNILLKTPRGRFYVFLFPDHVFSQLNSIWTSCPWARGHWARSPPRSSRPPETLKDPGNGTSAAPYGT